MIRKFISMEVAFNDDGHLAKIKAEPMAKKIKMPLPVKWDRKKKINNKHYLVVDWANKMHEEINEAHQCGAIAAFLKKRGMEADVAMCDNLENAELFDALAVIVSRLDQKKITPGSERWNDYVEAINSKNEMRNALVEHEEADDGAD